MRATLDFIDETTERLIVATLAQPKTPSVDPQLIEFERLDAIATMIRGLAHESRNALQRAVACLDLLELDLSESSRQLALSNKIRRSLSDLLNNYDEVKRFAEPIRLTRQLVGLHQLCEDAIGQVSNDGRIAQQGCDVSNHSRIDSQAWIDRARVVDVVKQLLENASAAPGSPKRIVITCNPVTSQGDLFHRLCVADDGDGFSDEALCRAFEPFFTTKQQGTGLGLSICRRIVLSHGGSIRVYNTNPRGAMAEVLLPATDGNVAPAVCS